MKKSKYVWVNLDNTHYLSVRQCMEELGYRVTTSETKNTLFWCDAAGNVDFAKELQPYQFYNHFPGMWQICRKVELARNYDRMARLCPEIFNFHPKSFIMPSQYLELRSYMLSIPTKSKRSFIVKPDKGAQGRGIIIVQDPDDLDDYIESAIAQQYISPYLVDGLKFDFRIYALVTSVDPLRIYIHQEGMARFCTQPYQSPRANNLDQVYAHLTNYSLNKHNENFKVGDENGYKRSLTSVWEHIERDGHDMRAVHDQIDDIIRLSLISIQPFLANTYHLAVPYNDGKSRCFEILGFDIMLDNNLKPWLLEVNMMPSLSCDSPFDRALKFSVIKGAMKIVDLKPNTKRVIMNRQKAMTQKRISGSTTKQIKDIFDPELETELAKTTSWRQLYPLDPKDPKYQIMENALSKSKAFPVGSAIETAATRARKEAVQNQIKEKQSPPPIRKKITPTPKKRVTPKPPPPVVKKQSISELYTTFNEELPVFVQFNDLPANPINETEERDRIKSIKHQQIITQSLSIQPKLNNIIKFLNSGEHSGDQDDQQPKQSKKQCKKQLLKPIIVYRQVQPLF